MCDNGKHRRKDRPNGGMYIVDGVVAMTLSTMVQQETVIVEERSVSKRCKKNLK